jgi:DNA-binding beta-propeller fold protein YncE
MMYPWRYCSSFLLCTTLLGATPQTDSVDIALAGKIARTQTLKLQEKPFLFRNLGGNQKLGAVSGVAVSERGNIYLIQRGSEADPILMFNKDGELIRSWGKGDFMLPHSLRLDSKGNVWAIDAGASKVIEYSSAGKKLLTIVLKPVPDNGSPFRGATDVAFAPNGHLFISDGYANARVLEYTRDGREVREWGRSGTGRAEFRLPHAIQIAANGTVYVADRENGRVEKFDLEGRFLGEIDGLGRCYALKLDHGVLWVSVSRMQEDPGSPGWLLKIDPVSGAVLSHIHIPDQREGHAMDLLPSGEPVVTAGNGLLVFRRY